MHEQEIRPLGVNRDQLVEIGRHLVPRAPRVDVVVVGNHRPGVAEVARTRRAVTVDKADHIGKRGVVAVHRFLGQVGVAHVSVGGGVVHDLQNMFVEHRHERAGFGHERAEFVCGDVIRIHVARTGETADEVIVLRRALVEILQRRRGEFRPVHRHLPAEGQLAPTRLGPDADADTVGLHEGHIHLLLRREFRIAGDLMVVGELEARREGELAVKTEIGQIVQALHLEPEARQQRRVLFLGVFRVGVPAEHGAERRHLGKQLLPQGNFFGVPAGIRREIVEEHFLPHAPVGHRRHPHRAHMAAHQHDRIMGATRPVPRVSIGVNLGVGLPGVTAAEVVDPLETPRLHLGDLRLRHDQRVFQPRDRERHVHRRRDRRFPDHVALGVLRKKRERLIRRLHFGEDDTVLALIEFKERLGDLPLEIFWVNDVELRRGTVRKPLQAHEHRLLRHPLGDEPIAVKAHDPCGPGHRLRRKAGGGE